MKTLVLYVYHQYNSRVDFFLQRGIFEDPDVDFVIVCNNPECKLIIPSYVKLYCRENIGTDFGGWSYGLFQENNFQKYDYFIFVNSSVYGPFTNKKWTDFFINGLNNNIELFGCTINCGNNPQTLSHVQSYAFSLKKSVLEILIKHEIFSLTNFAKTYLDAVYLKEILMSRIILSCGWNIGCLHHYYKNIDFTFKTQPPKNFIFCGDVMFQSYCDNFWTPEELIFIKGNRGINIQRV